MEYVKFQRNLLIFEVEQHGETNVSTVRRQDEYEIKVKRPVSEIKNKRPVTGSGCEITYISASACIHDSNEITTAIPVFSGSSNMTALVRILSYVSGVVMKDGGL